MQPIVATVVVSLVILAMFWMSRDPKARTSPALWLPVFWILINASRPVTLWLNLQPPVDSPEAVLDGSPLDALVFSTLLAAALAVLTFRARKAVALLRENSFLVLFFAYCAISVLWSEFPFVAFKRLWKGIGDIAMVMIVLTDADRGAAIKRLLNRTGFVLLLYSLLFIRYFPDLGRGYDRWEGHVSYTGVAVNKNMLGIMCLLFGIAALWQLIQFCQTEKGIRRIRRVIPQAIVLAIVVWIFSIADSVTSMACASLAAMLLILTSIRAVSRSRALVNLLVGGLLLTACGPLFLALGTDALLLLGRDATLTGRTEIWSLVLGLAGNPIIGTGYESFWLGRRLEQVWDLYHFPLNEAHNGYLELYLNLGWVGVVLLGGIMIAGYANILNSLRQNADAARLRVAIFLGCAAFSLTEAGFRMMSLSWIFLLLAITAPLKSLTTQTETAPETKPQPLWTPAIAAAHAGASQRKSL
jgi:O-antigen ligase